MEVVSECWADADKRRNWRILCVLGAEDMRFSLLAYTANFGGGLSHIAASCDEVVATLANLEHMANRQQLPLTEPTLEYPSSAKAWPALFWHWKPHGWRATIAIGIT